MRWRYLAIIVTLLAVAGGSVAFLAFGSSQGASSGPSSAPSEGLPSRLVTVTRGDIRSVLVLDGVVGPAVPTASQAPQSTANAAVAYDAVAEVAPSLLYRLYAPPVAIEVQIDRGPAPTGCTFVSVGLEGADPLSGPVRFRCRLPSTVRVFPGVLLRIAVVTGEATGALLLPVEAVAGSADQGFVTLAPPQGPHRRRTVQLGLTDGVSVQVLEGLSVGDRVTDPPELLPTDVLPDLGEPMATN